MIGQINSYISLMDENTTNEFVTRIYNMINSLPDSQDKTNLFNSYFTKKKQIEQIINFRKNKNAVEKVEMKNLTRSDIIEIYKRKKKIEEELSEQEIEKKVQEYINGKTYIKEKSSSTEIIISGYNLIRIGSRNNKLMRFRLFSKEQEEQPKKLHYNIPSLPIIENKA